MKKMIFGLTTIALISSISVVDAATTKSIDNFISQKIKVTTDMGKLIVLVIYQT